MTATTPRPRRHWEKPADEAPPSDGTPSALCPHSPNCVGCTFIGTPYGRQLVAKEATVRAALASYPSLADVGVGDIVGSPRAFGYRNQVKLVVRRARHGLLLGIYKPGSHQVVDIRACPVHHPLIGSVLAGLAEAVEACGTTIYDERSREGTLRYVVVRISQWAKQAEVILVTRDRSLPERRELLRRLLRLPRVSSVVQNVNPDPGNVVLGPEYVPLAGSGGLVERVGHLKLKTHAGAFLQANVPVAAKLYAHACAVAEVGAGDTVVDLYCGAGALTFHLAGQAHTVFGVESSPIAVADAKANVRLNGFHNVRFRAGEAAAGLAELTSGLPRIDVVTLNPPRKGADEATRESIAAAAARRIVYVSCEPSTLARDLDWFAAHGYRTLAVKPFDMLPQTEHVECVAVLAAA